MDTGSNASVLELREQLARWTTGEGSHQTAIPSLCLIRFSSSLTPLAGVLSPALCIAAQGHKELMVGEEIYSYGPGHHLVSSLELPVSARILGATSANPYLGLRLHFDPTRIAPLIEEARLTAPSGGVSERGLYIAPTPPALLDAVLRLVRLLRSPVEIPVLAPMIEREILFRLLMEESSAVLHRMAQPESQPQRIATAIARLRTNYRHAIRVEELARRAGMSASNFHQWFRRITGMSPVQFQKQLRLQEARSILRNERLDVGTVSRRVGYESSSQFSREYNRLFGNPPVREMRDARAG
jgi:AraC-like DNA-binding protein